VFSTEERPVATFVEFNPFLILRCSGEGRASKDAPTLIPRFSLLTLFCGMTQACHPSEGLHSVDIL